MSAITTYPTAIPKLDDLLLGTELKEDGNLTKNFRIGEVLALLGSTGLTPPTVNYGLFSQTADSIPVVNTTSQRPLFGTGVGSLTVPANSFAVGQAYQAKMIGHLSCLNSVTLTIVVATTTGVVLGTTGPITMSAATDKHWELDLNFTIRAIGGTGTARIISGGIFSYNKNSGSNSETNTFVTENNATFDTTNTNQLVIEAKWGTASASNSIYSNIFNLTRIY